MKIIHVDSQQPPPLTVEETLEILLLCFEAAADAYPPFLLAYAKQLPATSGIQRWLLWSTDDLDDPPEDAASLPPPPNSLIPAIARSNMCDAFADLIENEADKKLREHFGGSARWLITMPKPIFLLIGRRGRHQNEIPGHSVLIITTPEGPQMVMDGTGQQFGWDRSSWLLPLKEFISNRLGGQGDIDTRAQWASADQRKRAREAGMERLEGYWEVARERMEILFCDLDWDVLRRQTREERTDFVKRKAEERFEGTWEEAWQRQRSIITE